MLPLKGYNRSLSNISLGIIRRTIATSFEFSERARAFDETERESETEESYDQPGASEKRVALYTI